MHVYLLHLSEAFTSIWCRLSVFWISNRRYKWYHGDQTDSRRCTDGWNQLTSEWTHIDFSHRRQRPTLSACMWEKDLRKWMTERRTPIWKLMWCPNIFPNLCEPALTTQVCVGRSEWAQIQMEIICLWHKHPRTLTKDVGHSLTCHGREVRAHPSISTFLPQSARFTFLLLRWMDCSGVVT